ncbi:HlyD family secretion protein [Zooshikella sp. RANM57]|uniref:HlyD family secretion protein n=1 Tax=Zooshikella sp. RANM57 TaxID=3425863 RepID=UPI003D6E5F87
MPNPTKNSLFRAEVYEKLHHNFGKILIIRPISFSVYVIFIILFLAILICYLSWGTYRKIEVVSGVLEPSKGISEIFGVRNGVVDHINVTEGQLVQKGQPLVLVKTDRQTAAGNVDQELITQIEERYRLLTNQISKSYHILELEKERLKQKKINTDVELEHLSKQIKLRKEQKNSLAKDVLAYSNLYKRGQISESNYKNILNKKRELEINLHIDQRELGRLQMELNEDTKASQQKELEIENTIFKLSEEQLSLKQQLIETKSQKGYIIKSPVSGQVSALLAKVGQHVDTESLLLTILPAHSELIAELYIPSRSIGFTHPGQKVLIQYDAFPYQKFGHHEGEITAISHTILQPKYLNTSININEPVYKVSVKLGKQSIDAFGSQYNLQPGMQLMGSILGQQTTILGWIFEPIYSLRKQSLFIE